MNDSFTQSSVVFKESFFLITVKERTPLQEMLSLVKNGLPYNNSKKTNKGGLLTPIAGYSDSLFTLTLLTKNAKYVFPKTLSSLFPLLVFSKHTSGIGEGFV
jgi:hypothetical protein